MFAYQYVMLHNNQSKVHIFIRPKPLMIIMTANTHNIASNQILSWRQSWKETNITHVGSIYECGIPQE